MTGIGILLSLVGLSGVMLSRVVADEITIQKHEARLEQLKSVDTDVSDIKRDVQWIVRIMKKEQ